MNKHWHADWFQLFLSMISTVSVQSILDMAEYAIFILADISCNLYYLFPVKQCLQNMGGNIMSNMSKNSKTVIIFSK